VRKTSWTALPIFSLIEGMGNVPADDMRRTFNMGIGYILVVPPEASDQAVSLLKESGFDSYVIGRVSKGNKEVIYE